MHLCATKLEPPILCQGALMVSTIQGALILIYRPYNAKLSELLLLTPLALWNTDTSDVCGDTNTISSYIYL